VWQYIVKGLDHAAATEICGPLVYGKRSIDGEVNEYVAEDGNRNDVCGITAFGLDVVPVRMSKSPCGAGRTSTSVRPFRAIPLNVSELMF
jgi:hypothetical protein